MAPHSSTITFYNIFQNIFSTCTDAALKSLINYIMCKCYSGMGVACSEVCPNDAIPLYLGEDDKTCGDIRRHWKRTSLKKETEVTLKLFVIPKCTPFCRKFKRLIGDNFFITIHRRRFKQTTHEIHSYTRDIMLFMSLVIPISACKQ